MEDFAQSFNFRVDFEKLSERVANEGVSKVVIQTENDTMNDSVKLLKTLMTKFPSKEFFMSADNSKNPCCVDVNAAQHIDWDLIIKIGESCYSEDKIDKKKIVYLPKKVEIDFSLIKESFTKIEFETNSVKVASSLLSRSF